MTAANEAGTPPEEGALEAAEAESESPEATEAESKSPETVEAESGSTTGTAAAEPGEDANATKPAKKASPEAAKKAAPEETPEEAPPPPDPDTCKGIVIGQLAFEESVLAGEFDDSDFLFYLEPAGVLNASLLCTRAYPAETVRGGILMTKAARDARKVFLDDGVNPDEYELAFPKEFGYVKSLQHYVPESREHAKFPWSKKY